MSFDSLVKLVKFTKFIKLIKKSIWKDVGQGGAELCKMNNFWRSDVQ